MALLLVVVAEVLVDVLWFSCQPFESFFSEKRSNIFRVISKNVLNCLVVLSSFVNTLPT